MYKNMSNLKRLSKIQYKNFEPGEFVEEKDRTYEEVIAIIENIPWGSEGDKILVGLTNTSVTMVDDYSNYLKFAIYYNGKFVLHYFDSQQNLFTKSFVEKKDAYTYIASFFEQKDFDLHDFRKETTWFQKNLIHFVSQDFRYTINSESTFKFIRSSSGFNIIIVIFYIILFITTLINGGSDFFPWQFAFFLLFVIFLSGGLNIILIINYYLFAKNKMLIMSKGNDIFYFGDENNPIKYDKKNITQVVTYRSKGRKSPVSRFAVVEIEFKDGPNISIPDIFVSYPALQNKLFQYPQIDKAKFPFLRTWS
jgi:hypothetical protein